MNVVNDRGSMSAPMRNPSAHSWRVRVSIGAAAVMMLVVWAVGAFAPRHSAPASEPAVIPRGAPLDAPTTPAPAVASQPTANVDRIVQKFVKEVEVGSAAAGADQEYTPVSFQQLAGFDYDPFIDQDTPAEPGQAAKRPDQIPAEVKALSGRKVAVGGFMVPVEIKKGEVKSFLLMRSQLLCCFGMMVGMNEWVFVQMEEGRSTRFHPDVPLLVYGTIDVGEEIEDGVVVSIYRMRGREVVAKGGF
jgi:hypothetical protein